MLLEVLGSGALALSAPAAMWVGLGSRAPLSKAFSIRRWEAPDFDGWPSDLSRDEAVVEVDGFGGTSRTAFFISSAVSTPQSV